MGFDFFNVLSLIGGLSLFLFGMNIMGDSLAKTAGGKLERILEKLTSTPDKGSSCSEPRVTGSYTVLIGDDRYGCRFC